MKTGIELIATERQEQIEKHGRSEESDIAENGLGQLELRAYRLIEENEVPPLGWNEELWQKMVTKPRKERIIIAAALLAAEIDRLQAISQKRMPKVEEIDKEYPADLTVLHKAHNIPINFNAEQGETLEK